MFFGHRAVYLMLAEPRNEAGSSRATPGAPKVEPHDQPLSVDALERRNLTWPETSGRLRAVDDHLADAHLTLSGHERLATGLSGALGDRDALPRAKVGVCPLGVLDKAGTKGGGDEPAGSREVALRERDEVALNSRLHVEL